MKRLLLLRHAKAEQAGKDDHARKLTGRGRKDAARMGAWLHKNYAIDLVLCSTSARTRETWELVAAELGETPKVEFVKALYLAPVRTMLELVQSASDGASIALVIGHNPGTEETASALVRPATKKDEQKRLDTLKEKYPTAAVSALTFEIDSWRDLKVASGTLAEFVRPKDLD
jgi:phosphohistidine phosphatase